jgi:hypothetical protein
MRGAAAIPHPRALPTPLAAQGAVPPMRRTWEATPPFTNHHLSPRAKRAVLPNGQGPPVLTKPMSQKTEAPRALQETRVLTRPVSPQTGAPRAIPTTPLSALTRRPSRLASPAPQGIPKDLPLPPRLTEPPRRPDAIPIDCTYVLPHLMSNDAETDPLPSPAQRAKSKYLSLLQPQDLARRLLPKTVFKVLMAFATKGVPTECGDPWTPQVIELARQAGPHVSALTPENVQLINEDIDYQEKAGFVEVVTETDLFGDAPPKELKLSRVAVVPQTNRRGRIILNLSAPVFMATRHSRCPRNKVTVIQPAVNETTVPADDQSAVKELGVVLPSLVLYMYHVPCTWTIHWQKIDLSDGFWRMVVQYAKRYNFVYEMPSLEALTEKRFVVPLALQMGWMNSPAYFCTATSAIRLLTTRLLAVTLSSGVPDVHVHEEKCFPEGAYAPSSDRWQGPPPTEFMMLAAVFVDDFMNGVALAPGSGSGGLLILLWVARCAMHAIHAVFPPPEITGHDGGRDSVSTKKLLKGDAAWMPQKLLLGFIADGSPEEGRTIGLPREKTDSYRAHLRQILQANYVSLREFQKLQGRLQHSSFAMPSMRGFMTPLNATLRKAPQTIGLGKASELREVLEDFDIMLEAACVRPSHITELMGPYLPHYYGYCDASADGAGGVWLPATRWCPALVWRLRWPAWVEAEVRKKHGRITNSDVECAAIFIMECILEHYITANSAGVATWLGSDNSPSVSWNTRMASRSMSRIPDRMLRLLAMRQRITRRGPMDINHVKGILNGMADFASRAFASDPSYEGFTLSFTHKFPLPAQLGSWKLVPVPSGIVSATLSILRMEPLRTTAPGPATGAPGLDFPALLANTLPCTPSSARPTTWNEQGCSWPLLSPSGKVCSTTESVLVTRRSRRHSSVALPTWSTTALQTLGDEIRPKRISTPDSVDS